MPVGRNTFDSGFGYKGNVVDELIVYFTRPSSIITLHPFTITSVNSTPTIQHVGDRPAVGMAGAGAGSDGNNFMIGVAGVRPQAIKAIEWFWTMRSAGITDHEFVCGWAPVGTGITAAVNGGTEPTDELMVYKDTAETRLSLKARKASGTEASQQHGTMAALANDTWYRGHCLAERDSTTAGKGTLRCAFGEDASNPITQISQLDIAAAFPDTVSMAFVIGWLAGAAVTTQMNFGMAGYRIYA